MRRLLIHAVLIALSALLIAGCARRIAINTDPPGAQIRLVEKDGDDSYDLGLSPVSSSVSAADYYYVIAEKPGYRALKYRISIGEKDSYYFELVPVYDLTIDTEPTGAIILLEDKKSGWKRNLGTAPVKYSVEGKGPYVVSASLDGYESAVEELATIPGTRAFATIIRLKPK